ncbi:hypothetical protein NT6N_34430 [Oceaniferula spumae]|uniref:DUF2269 family protein n=1 Tax=Oceaniferula spumae TaxID=2979115 RepID=A0AAT9FQZ7_9BACT
MSPPPAPDALVANSSPIPKVFGIIHIVYAGLGAVGALFAIGSVFLMRAVMSKAGSGTEEVNTFLEAYNDMAIYSYIDAALKIVLAVMLLTAGIGLLKKKLWGQKLSVFWAVTRIISAIVMVVLTMGPAREFQEKMGEVTQSQAGGVDQSQLQGTLQSVSGVMSIIMLCIYPVVSLIFLSRKSVKDVLK